MTPATIDIFGFFERTSILFLWAVKSFPPLTIIINVSCTVFDGEHFNEKVAEKQRERHQENEIQEETETEKGEVRYRLLHLFLETAVRERSISVTEDNRIDWRDKRD